MGINKSQITTHIARGKQCFDIYKNDLQNMMYRICLIIFGIVCVIKARDILYIF